MAAHPNKVGKVMGEFKRGKLRSGSKHGPVVKKRSQAVAIAMSEAGLSKKSTKGSKPFTKKEMQQGFRRL